VRAFRASPRRSQSLTSRQDSASGDRLGNSSAVFPCEMSPRLGAPCPFLGTWDATIVCPSSPASRVVVREIQLRLDPPLCPPITGRRCTPGAPAPPAGAQNPHFPAIRRKRAGLRWVSVPAASRQHAHVQIAVQTQRQRPRNRRSRHHSTSGSAPSVPSGLGFFISLNRCITQAVLLNPLPPAQPVELHLFLDKRVPSRSPVAPRPGDIAARLSLAGLQLKRAGQQGNP